ncbi:hypothetical protein FS837_001167, partial [Tulasnella sp. UAMH 9824]
RSELPATAIVGEEQQHQHDSAHKQLTDPPSISVRSVDVPNFLPNTRQRTVYGPCTLGCHLDSPSKARIQFRIDQVSAAIEIAFANAVVNLTSVRYIDLWLKKHAIGRAIANMVGKLELRDVRLNFSKEDVPGALEPHPSSRRNQPLLSQDGAEHLSFADAQAYPVLETIHLSASADCVVDTLQFFDLPSSLRHLQIHPTALSLDDLTFMAEVISTNPTNLKTCVISDTRLWMNKRSIGNVPPFTMRPLYPLLILIDLEIVKIDLDVVYHLTDDDLDDMASAWPKLQVLHICPWKEVEPVSATTLPSLVGLRTLTTACPKLLELKLKVDASRNLGDVTKSLGKSTRARGAELRKWFIGVSAIQEEQAEAVAEVIHLLFSSWRHWVCREKLWVTQPSTKSGRRSMMR